MHKTTWHSSDFGDVGNQTLGIRIRGDCIGGGRREDLRHWVRSRDLFFVYIPGIFRGDSCVRSVPRVHSIVNTQIVTGGHHD